MIDLKTKNVQKRYEGFLNTPSLWSGNKIEELQQFEIENKSALIDIDINEKLRLGKYVERFVGYQLQQETGISVLSENIQIQREKRTLGELDCILKKGNVNIHLEIIYKFYLIDKTVGETEIEHCIGPNRKDSLVEKLKKLKEKQLPLLYAKESEAYLKSIQLSDKEIIQYVYFKAQLFVAYSDKKIRLNNLNNNCIMGYYLHKSEMQQFSSCKFFIPVKKDWLICPHTDVDWYNFDVFKEKSQEFLSRKFSPLFWIKKSNGEFLKCFLVWWDV